MKNINSMLKSKKFLAVFIIGLVTFIFITYFFAAFYNHSPSNDYADSTPHYQNQDQYNFDLYSNQLFKINLSNDYLSLHFYLEHPEKWNINVKEPTLGEYSYQSMMDSQKFYINQINILKKFNYNQLSVKQKITYDTLAGYFNNQLDFADLCLCSEILSPTTGLQSQLPILFSEYTFKNKQDITTYLKLLSQVYDYFKDICDFQKLKAKENVFISSFCCQNIINQCQDFVGDKVPENNLLHKSFVQKINECSFLSGSILDRMDLCVHMNPVSFMEIKSDKEQESSEEIRKRVDLAAAIQRERYKYENFNYNSQLQGEFIEKYCALDRKEEKLIKDVYEKMNLSVRAYEKILKVARTIADLKGKNKISTEDLAEAISFKTIESVG